MRRVVLGHGALSFAYSSALIAIAISVLAR